MKLHRATTKETAIKVKILKNGEPVDYIIDREVRQLFGDKDGDYFVLSSQNRTIPSGKKYRLVYVEDKDGDRHQLFFELVS